MSIVSQVSTSSFKPLSLDEIMMVPLAKQKQEDAAVLALDQLDAMKSNSLDVDKEYVQSQVDAFRNESDKISSDIMERGVDRSIINRVRDLKKRKDDEFSASGRTGQASLAFNAYQKNKEDILKRKDLTESQKRLGIQNSLKNYTGVAQGGSYEDYIGNSYIDVMNKGRQIASQMKPEEKAAALGIHYDEETQTYRDGTKSYKQLSPNHIKQVVYGALKNDREVSNYLKEIESFGEGSADEMMRQAAISAGDVYQVSSIKDMTRVVKNPYGANKVLEGNGGADLKSKWSSNTIQNGANEYMKKSGIDEDSMKKINFSGGKINFSEFKGKKTKRIPMFSKTDRFLGFDEVKSNDYKSWENKNNASEKAYKAIQELRKDDPQGFAGKTDKYVFESYLRGAQRAAASFATVVRPDNNLSSFYEHYNSKLLGKNGSVGDLTSGMRSIKIMGQEGDGSKKTPSQIASDLGFDNMAEFNLALKEGLNEHGKATVEGMVNDPDIPMGIVVHLKDSEGVSHRLVVSPQEEVSRSMGQASRMMDNLRNGISFEVSEARGREASGQSGVHYEHYVNKAQHIEGFNNNTGYVDYTPNIIYSKRKFTEDEAKRIEWDPQYQRATLDGEYLPNTKLMTYDEQVSHSMNRIAKKWDATKTGRTTKDM